MSAAQLMIDLARLEIRIEAHGGRLRYSPRSAVTPDLADRMKAHKSELLAILRGYPVTRDVDVDDATQVWQATLDRLEGNSLFARDVMRALRSAEARWGEVEDKSLSTWRCHCGSTEHRDVAIHDGQSVRRDCARCKRFISFPIWYSRLQEGGS